MKKKLYNHPETTILPVRFYNALCASAGGSGSGSGNESLGGDGSGANPWEVGRAPMAL